VRLSYLGVRLLQILPTFLLIMVVAFVLVRLLPGDPTSALLGIKANDADVARANAELGLDKPIPIQFLYFLKNFFKGDLGQSIVLKVPVASLIVQRLPVTLFLTGLALAVCLPACATMISVAVSSSEQGEAMGNNQSVQVGAEGLSGLLGGLLAAIDTSIPLIVLLAVAIGAAGILARWRPRTDENAAE